MATIRSKRTWDIDNPAIRRGKGPLIRIEIRPGQFVKMYEADAIEKGLIKARPPVEDKQQGPALNKGDRTVSTETVASGAGETAPAEAAGDVFTDIPGVGAASARAIVAHGISTFEQLKDAGELDYLTAAVNRAIETWRGGA